MEGSLPQSYVAGGPPPFCGTREAVHLVDLLNRDAAPASFLRPFPHVLPGGFRLESRAGWNPLLDDLFGVLETLIVEGLNRGEWCQMPGHYVARGYEVSWPRVLRVQEKFGRLRVHITERTPEIVAAIQVAQERAAVTCELCSAPGILSNAPMRVRCGRHRESFGVGL